MKPREIAVSVLSRTAGGDDFAEKRLENACREHPLTPPDRRLIQELVFGVLRWQSTLDWLISKKTDQRPQVAGIQTLLRLGLYQMFWLDRIPNYAAVNETVDIAKRRGFGRQAGFINAVLRAYTREKDQTAAALDALKNSDPALGHSHPEWLFQRWERQWDRTAAVRIMEWNNTPPPTFARLNALLASPELLADAWRQEGVKVAAKDVDWAESGTVYELQEHPPLAELPSFQKGWFYVQDPSTLLAVRLLQPQPGETILDACAAPGGKAAYIAQQMKNQGLIVAEDLYVDRLRLIEENGRRLGVTCMRIQLPASPETGQVSAEIDRTGEAQPELFDRILVDAPCSNTGVIRRRIELRWRLRAAEIQRLTAEQLAILKRNAPRLKPGGLLVYSTCSLEDEENRGVVERFAQACPEFKLEQERQLAPWRDGVDGAYIACLRRSGPP